MDLSTRYMGLDLTHPVVASASPLSQTLDGIRRLEDEGAAAVVMFSLFEEQINQENAVFDHLMEIGTDSFAESLSYFPEPVEFHTGTDAYLDLIRRARNCVDIPLIASLNGTTNTGWIDFATGVQSAGASAIELNIYEIPTDLALTGSQVEQGYVEIVRSVKSAVTIPVAIKLSPYFSAFANMARLLELAGADALVLFNRFYQPDFDLQRLELLNNLTLSSPNEIRLPLLWIAILRGRITTSIAATTGVHGADEVVKYLLAGADVVMSTSALLQHGPAHLGVLREGLERWMIERGYDSVTQLKGSMCQQNVSDPSAFERANYLKILDGYDL